MATMNRSLAIAIFIGSSALCISSFVFDDGHVATANGNINEHCVDRSIDCGFLGQFICTNTSLRPWVAINCARYCNFCDCYDENATLCRVFQQYCYIIELSTDLCRKSCNSCVDDYDPSKYLAAFRTTLTTHSFTTSMVASKTETTTIPTTTLPPVHAKECSKFGLIIDLTRNTQVSHPDAHACPDGTHTSTEAAIYYYCNAPTDRRLWRHEVNIWKNCDRIPHYSPIATFDFFGNIAGVFIKCEENGFQIAVQRCGEPLNIIHVTPNITGYPAIDQYFLIDWK